MHAGESGQVLVEFVSGIDPGICLASHACRCLGRRLVLVGVFTCECRARLMYVRSPHNGNFDQGDYLELDDLAKLQGVDLYGYNLSGVGKPSVGAMLGNAMSGNVLEFLLPEALVAAGWMSPARRDELRGLSLLRYLAA